MHSCNFDFTLLDVSISVNAKQYLSKRGVTFWGNHGAHKFHNGDSAKLSDVLAVVPT
jgi:hypothetical protein